MSPFHLYLFTTIPYVLSFSTINYSPTVTTRHSNIGHPLHQQTPHGAGLCYNIFPSAAAAPQYYDDTNKKGRFKRNYRLLSSVTVYDETFSSSTCKELHYLAVDHSTRGDDGSSLFIRPPNNERPLTPLEHAIDSALVALGDTSRKVEYWSRDEFMNIDVHADIDELHLEEGEEDDDGKESGLLRCPKMGHVLYLEVEDGLRCPTCVFPNKRTGWDVMNKDYHHTNRKDKQQQQQQTPVELITIPAVQGRILMFPGSAMHSVPRPTHRWFLSKEEEDILRKEEEAEAQFGGDDCDEDEDEDEDDNDDDDNYDDNTGLSYNDSNDYDVDYGEEKIERSVLLFNTWPDDETGPRGISGDYISGAIPDGVELSEGTLEDFARTKEAQRLLEWEEEYGINAKSLSCNPIADWKQVDVHFHYSDSEIENGTVRPSLMGNQKRRVSMKKFVCLKGPAPALHKALQEEEKVWQFQMKE